MGAFTDTILRVLIFVAGAGSFGAFVVVWIETPAWPVLGRLAVVTPLLGVFELGVGAFSDIRLPMRARKPLRLRRQGERDLWYACDEDFWQEALASRTSQHGSTAVGPGPARFALDRRNSALSAGISAGVLAAALLASVRANPGEEFTTWLVLNLLALPASLFVVTRSLVRIATSRRAVSLDADGLILGVALGYVPPLRVPRSRISAVVAEEWTARLCFIVDRKVGYSLQPAHIRNAMGIIDWVRNQWPEVPVGTLELPTGKAQ